MGVGLDASDRPPGTPMESGPDRGVGMLLSSGNDVPRLKNSG
eukprot:CAMPEP_0174329476 /NCGR_PEP_ID=MMETSP0810-20121108/15878_1 /TAXON_ID=73025 ORGANISM="Eutreptiella gymnastica-like, Strain CCMP1594" /NCGR_SAMPLE_ID=MMETSP0810 /ASSEMBLY_ACC=CAM_ASM_000659 /LENGTH=41 /DNA_ID= /DNA_START= /DNA_END= /DNA_ORIENTATION=